MLHRNHEVWVAYDDVAVPELAPSIPSAGDLSTATAYLMSEKDKVFSVNWRHLVPRSLLFVSIRMDGVPVYQHVSSPGMGMEGGQLCGVVSGPNSIRLFLFSDIPRLQCLDSQVASADAAACQDFGTILVTIVPLYFVHNAPALASVDGPLCSNVSCSPRSDIHRISLQKECSFDCEIGGGQLLTVPLVPPFEMQEMSEEMAVFEFRYGPLVCLQNIGVVPARTGIIEGGPVRVPPPVSIPSMLGKRSCSQYEDILSPSKEAEKIAGAAPVMGIGTFVTRRWVKEEVADDSVGAD